MHIYTRSDSMDQNSNHWTSKGNFHFSRPCQYSINVRIHLPDNIIWR